jgi:hypothetical protein
LVFELRSKATDSWNISLAVFKWKKMAICLTMFALLDSSN